MKFLSTKYATVKKNKTLDYICSNQRALNILLITRLEANTLKKSSTLRVSINDKILSLFIKKGLKNKIINNFSKSMRAFFYIFFHKTIDHSELNYVYLNEFRTQLYQNSSYLNVFIVIKNILDNLSPFFFLKSAIIEKRFRKKKDEKYMYKISYIFSKNRLNKALNFFYLGFFKIKQSNIKTRFLLFLLDILLNYKKSYIFEYKINTYKKLFLS